MSDVEVARAKRVAARATITRLVAAVVASSDGRQMATMAGVGPAMAGAMAGVVAGRAPMAGLVATTAATRAAVSGLV